MKCYIKNKLVEAKVVETLGFQGGRYAKVVEYNCEEFVIVKDGKIWKQHVPSLQFGAGYRGQSS